MIQAVLALLLATPDPDVPDGLRAAEPQEAQEPAEWRAGLRLQIWTAFGTPANDITGGSLYVSRNVGGPWWLTLEGYAGVFDFENPGDAVLGTSGTPTADAKIDMQALWLTLEWHPLDRRGIFDVYLGGSVGAVKLGDDEARHPPEVDVEVDGGSGAIVQLIAGAALRVYGPVYVTGELRYAYVLADMEVSDRQSPLEDEQGPWDALGFSVGLEVRF